MERAAGDNKFIGRLTDEFTEAVKDYELTWEEHAVPSISDVRWIKTHIGKMDIRLRTRLGC